MNINPRLKITLSAITAFLTPLGALFILQTFFSDIYIRNHILHSSVMAITGLLSFYIFWRAYKTYNANKGDSTPLFLLSLSFLTMGAVFIFHAIAISDIYIFSETIFDIFEHYGLFFGALILLGVLFPYNQNITRAIYASRKIFLFSLVIFLAIFSILVVFSTPVAEFLSTHINLAIGLTGISFFVNALFLLLSHDYNRKSDRLSFYLIIGFLILTSSGIVPFFYKEWNAVWWFSHIIFIAGFIFTLVELFKQKRTEVSFGEVFSNTPLGAKIILNYSVTIILGIFILSYLNYYSAEKNLKNQLFHDLALTSAVEKENVLGFLDYTKSRAVDFSSDGFIRDSAKQIINEKNTAEIAENLNAHLVKNKMSLDKGIIGINVLDLNGKIIASTNIEEMGKDESKDDYFMQGKNSSYGDAYVSDVVIKQSHFNAIKSFFTASTVLTDRETREPIGIIVNYYDATTLNEIVSGRYGSIIEPLDIADKNIENTMEIFIANADGLMITESKFVKNAILRQRINTEAYWKCKENKNIRGIYNDYRGVKVVSASECLPNGWLLVTKIDVAEAFILLKDIQKEAAIFSIVLLSLIVLISSLLAKAIIFPIRKLDEAAKKIGLGDLSARAEVISKDEIGSLAQTFNGMVVQLKQLYEGLERKVKDRTMELAQKVNEVEHEKDKLSTILYGIGDGVLVVNGDGKIIIWNDVAEKISGFSTKEVIGKKYNQVLSFINEKTGKPSNDFIQQTITGGEIIQMPDYTMLIRKNGSQIAVVDSSAPLKNKNGEIVGCVMIFRDATKERDIDRMKTEFVSIASHQLRSPLTAIKLSAEILADADTGKLNAEQKNYLSNIQQSAQNMTSLVNDLLNISRLEAGKIQINPKPVNLKELIDKVLDNLSVISVAHNCKISVNAGIDLMPEIITDPDLMRQVIYNLISNAIQYSSPDGNRVDIEINRAEDNDHLIISIKDAGIGIPEEARKRMFEKFFRAENAIKTKVDGTGLGLYIVKMIIENLGGNVWFDSMVDTGTTFYVKIPTKSPPPPAIKKI